MVGRNRRLSHRLRRDAPASYFSSSSSSRIIYSKTIKSKLLSLRYEYASEGHKQNFMDEMFPGPSKSQLSQVYKKFDQLNVVRNMNVIF